MYNTVSSYFKAVMGINNVRHWVICMCGVYVITDEGIIAVNMYIQINPWIKSNANTMNEQQTTHCCVLIMSGWYIQKITNCL